MNQNQLSEESLNNIKETLKTVREVKAIQEQLRKYGVQRQEYSLAPPGRKNYGTNR
jgi:hypothetical protein